MQKKVIAKRIKPKSRFVKLFEPNNFITLLHVYGAYGKTKNILHIWCGWEQKMLGNISLFGVKEIVVLMKEPMSPGAEFAMDMGITAWIAIPRIN